MSDFWFTLPTDSPLPKNYGMIPSSATSDSELTATDKLLLAVLTQYANPTTGRVGAEGREPSRAQFAKRIGSHVDTVSRSLTRLVNAGWLVRKRRMNAPSVLYLRLPERLCVQSAVLSPSTAPVKVSGRIVTAYGVATQYCEPDDYIPDNESEF